MTVVGQPIPHDSAKGHVSGQSIYIDDMPLAKNELMVDFWGSPVAHGRILKLDLAAARQIPGVVDLFTYKDLDGHNLFGPVLQDEVLLVEEVAEFIGHPIVVIAAEDKKAIELAKNAITLEMEELPPVLSIDEAIEKQQFIFHTLLVQRGNLQQAFQEADHILAGEFYTNGQEHVYFESQSAIAYPGENNTLVVYSSTQHPSEVQAVIADVLGLQLNQVVCVTKRMGGAFGGKECQAVHPAAMAALVAHKLKRPARIHLGMDDDMAWSGKRHPFKNWYKVALTKDGLILGLQVDLYANGGAANDLSTGVMGRAICHAENAYYIPHIKIAGTVCKTNLPPNTAFRGFGGPQGIANMENLIEEIAIYLKRDAYEIRRLNCYGIDERNTTPYGQVVRNNKLPAIMERLAITSDYQDRLAAVKGFNAGSKTHLKGIALTPMKFGISFNTKFLNQANALVNVYLDGTVQVSTGATEMGQGVNTKIAQLVADTLCISVESVMVMPTSTEKNHNTSATAASSSADLNGSAAVNASLTLRERLLDFASQHFARLSRGLEPGVQHLHWDSNGILDKRLPEHTLTFQELVKLAYLERINLGERGFHATEGIEFSWETGSGSPFLYFTTGCAVSEVLIDRFTGNLQVLRADLLMDIGRSINPGIDRGQIVGGFMQGLGWLTTEELVYSEDGHLLSHSPTTYKIPSINDLPEIFEVDWIANDENTVNIKSSKAVGEPPLMLALSVWCAVKHALSFVSNGEIPTLHIPATNQEILARLTQYQSSPALAEPSALLKV